MNRLSKTASGVCQRNIHTACFIRAAPKSALPMCLRSAICDAHRRTFKRLPTYPSTSKIRYGWHRRGGKPASHTTFPRRHFSMAEDQPCLAYGVPQEAMMGNQSGCDRCSGRKTSLGLDCLSGEQVWVPRERLQTVREGSTSCGVVGEVTLGCMCGCGGVSKRRRCGVGDERG